MEPVRRTSVLVVEDDDAVRELYRQELVQAGFLVTAVPDGVDALKRIDAGLLPDVIVLDLLLPCLHGLDLHAELKAHSSTKNVPIIVVTGSDKENWTRTSSRSCFASR